MERKFLGELATSCTMTSFGYESSVCQNGSSHGFDGVFSDPLKELGLFLTESKFREESRSAQDYLRSDLSEHEIFRKLQQMKCPKTQELVKGFIARFPQRIFKFAHRVLPTGKCECCIEKFHSDIFQNSFLHTFSPKTSEDEKGAVLAQLNRQLYATPEGFLRACLKVSGLSAEEYKNLIFEQ